MPTQVDLMWPTLRALEGLGGSALIHELDDRVSADLNLTDGLLDVPHGDGPQTEFAYRLAWARTRLRRIGAVDNSARGVWTITGAGRRIGSADEPDAFERLCQRLLREHGFTRVEVTGRSGDGERDDHPGTAYVWQ